MRDFAMFVGFAAGLLAALLSGGVTWVVDAVAHEGNAGDAATWFSAIATTTVAYLAWRTSRDAAGTAKAAYANQLRVEASNVTWSFDTGWHGQEVMSDPTIRAFLPPSGHYPWEVSPPELVEVSRFVIVEVVNENASLVSEATILMSDSPPVEATSAGLQRLGALRPGRTRFWACIKVVGGSAGALWSDTVKLYENGFAEWLEFTDSKGHRWRRKADGTLDARDSSPEL